MVKQMDKTQYLQIAKKVNLANFDDFMEHYHLTQGQLLGLIESALYSNLSLLQATYLKKLLQKKKSLFQLTDTKVGIVSDIHIGHSQMNWDYVYRAYDFFAENDIYTVFNLGDLFHGFYYKSRNNPNRAVFECYSQLVDFETHYPKGFTTFLIHGNHEKRFEDVGMDLWEHIPAKRNDVFSIGEGRCCVTLGNSILSLNHPTLTNDFIPSEENSFLSLTGHGHAFYKNQKHLSVTTCSDFSLQKNSYGLAVPGFAILEDEKKQLTFKGYSLEDKEPREVRQYIFIKKR